MPEEPNPDLRQPVDTTPQELPTIDEEREKEIGDFVTRHVLEKDSVFFEG